MRQGQWVAKSPGFTLIELLVVLVILGTLVGLTVMSAGIAGPSRALKQEAERLSALIGLLVDEAELTHQEFALSVLPNGYQVLQLAADGSWQSHSRLYQLGGAARLSYQSADQTPLAGAAIDEPVPAIVLFSNGEISPFELIIQEPKQGGQRYRLASDGFNLPDVESLP